MIDLLQPTEPGWDKLDLRCEAQIAIRQTRIVLGLATEAALVALASTYILRPTDEASATIVVKTPQTGASTTLGVRLCGRLG